MNILYTVNDKFVPQIGAGICSVCENNKSEEDIHFYVLSIGITESNKTNLTSLVQRYKREIFIIEIEDIDAYLDFDFDTLGWSPVILARLFMGRILPTDVDKILYMDGDTIVRGSLSELWNMDLGQKILGMSIEPTVDKERKKALGLEDYYYHNSGVLLVDLNKWRQEKAEEAVIEFYREKKGNLFAADQDAINGGLRGKICAILPKYNFCNIYYQYPYKFLCKLISPMQYFSRAQFEASVKDPVIIHYLGEERPWRRGNTHKYKEDYRKYLNMTCWRDVPDEEGWQLYFVCWRVFNFITKPFPQLRYSVINYLIPYFMKYRARVLKKGQSSAK